MISRAVVHQEGGRQFMDRASGHIISPHTFGVLFLFKESRLTSSPVCVDLGPIRS